MNFSVAILAQATPSMRPLASVAALSALAQLIPQPGGQLAPAPAPPGRGTYVKIKSKIKLN